tara:strand:+ start:265 stop:399 length:135 start_codon:yes stop_codon:yes gene_type:complete
MLKRGFISMVVICYATDIIEYDKITPEQYNAAPHLAQDTNIIEV